MHIEQDIQRLLVLFAVKARLCILPWIYISQIIYHFRGRSCHSHWWNMSWELAYPNLVSFSQSRLLEIRISQFLTHRIGYFEVWDHPLNCGTILFFAVAATLAVPVIYNSFLSSFLYILSASKVWRIYVGLSSHSHFLPILKYVDHRSGEFNLRAVRNR